MARVIRSIPIDHLCFSSDNAHVFAIDSAVWKLLDTLRKHRSLVFGYEELNETKGANQEGKM